MKKILKALGDELKEEELLEKSIEIEAFYKEKNFNLYSETFLIVNEVESDEVDYIIKNLQSILNTLEERESPVCENIKKLIDFIQMEQMREAHIMNDYIKKLSLMIKNVSRRQLKEITEQRNNIKEQFDNIMFDVDNKMNDISIEFNKQSNEIEKFNGNLVSVLGIFGAIIVAFFGGLSFLGGVLDNMHNVSAYRLIFIGTLYLVGLFDIIFLLFYCISKIVHKPLWTNSANKSECSECTKVNRCICFIKKYPLVSYFNIASIFLLLNIVFLYTVDRFNISSQIIEWFNWNSTKGLNIMFGIMLIYSSVSLLVGIVIWILSSMKVIKNCLKCPCNITQNSGQEQCNCNNNVNEVIRSRRKIIRRF